MGIMRATGNKPVCGDASLLSRTCDGPLVVDVLDSMPSLDDDEAMQEVYTHFGKAVLIYKTDTSGLCTGDQEYTYKREFDGDTFWERMSVYTDNQTIKVTTYNNNPDGNKRRTDPEPQTEMMYTFDNDGENGYEVYPIFDEMMEEMKNMKVEAQKRQDDYQDSTNPYTDEDTITYL